MRRSIVSAAVACVLLAACGGAERPAAGTSSVSEPLPPGAIAFDYDSHLYFDALVADSLPARLVFDTGAVQLSLDSLWFERHAGAFDGMRIGCAVMRGAGQQAEVARMLLDSLAFGIDTLRWQSSMPVIHDLKKILGRKIDGIFGQQFLDGRCVAFDYRRGSMRAVSPDTLAAAGYRRIPARKEGCRIYFPMRIRFDAGHTVEGDFLLDTGCGLAAIVATAAADKAGLELMEGMKLPYETASGGVGGRAESYVCRAAEVALGEYTLRDVVVEVSRNGTGFLASKEADCGIVGNGILERFDFAVDFRAETVALWVRPAERFAEPFALRSPGFVMIDRTDVGEGYVVTGLYAGCAPAGLAAGDEVFEWDGQPIGSLPDSAICRPGHHRFLARRGELVTEYETNYKEIL